MTMGQEGGGVKKNRAPKKTPDFSWVPGQLNQQTLLL
jgi:hypothetical protein